uniref:Uncharacterized protein n=1 Tax=Acrobeloides nanus TaxID=290746 RepID=A0A914C3M6_9BILA
MSDMNMERLFTDWWEFYTFVIIEKFIKTTLLNTAKRIWNGLPANVASISDPVRFKTVVKETTIYDLLTRKGIVARTEIQI